MNICSLCPPCGLDAPFWTLSVLTLSPADSVLPAHASLVLGRAEEKVWGLWGLEPRNYGRRVIRVLGLGAAGAAGGEFVTFEGFVHFLAGLAIEVHLDFSPHATNSDAEDTLTGLHQVDNLAG